MFDAVQGMNPAYVLAGVIWALALGFAAGNYACSLVHRLPRGRAMLDKTPYCGSCGTLLGVKDLFPVFSALMLKHRCRYCGQKFPASHTWTEVLVGLLFVLAFFRYHFSEQFILVVFLGVFLVTLAAIEANEKIVMGRVLLSVAVSGMLWRVLADGTIYNFFEGGLFGLILGAALWRRRIEKVGHIYRLPPHALLLAVGGVSVGAKGLPQFLALYAGMYVMLWLFKRPVTMTVPFGFAVMLTVMYPQLVSF